MHVVVNRVEAKSQIIQMLHLLLRFEKEHDMMHCHRNKS